MKRLKFILTGVLTALSPLFVHTQSIRQNFDLGWQFSETRGTGSKLTCLTTGTSTMPRKLMLRQAMMGDIIPRDMVATKRRSPHPY